MKIWGGLSFPQIAGRCGSRPKPRRPAIPIRPGQAAGPVGRGADPMDQSSRPVRGGTVGPASARRLARTPWAYRLGIGRHAVPPAICRVVGSPPSAGSPRAWRPALVVRGWGEVGPGPTSIPPGPAPIVALRGPSSADAAGLSAGPGPIARRPGRPARLGRAPPSPDARRPSADPRIPSFLSHSKYLNGRGLMRHGILRDVLPVRGPVSPGPAATQAPDSRAGPRANAASSTGKPSPSCRPWTRTRKSSWGSGARPPSTRPRWR